MPTSTSHKIIPVLKSILLLNAAVLALFSSGPLYSQKDTGEIYYERLFLTCKVWGFLKYLHSEVARGNRDWDMALIRTLEEVRSDGNDQEFNDSLTDMIDAAGEMAKPTVPLPEVPDSLKYNLDFKWLEDPMLSEVVRASLDTIRDRFRPQKNHYVGEQQGVGNPTFDKDDQFFEWRGNEYPDEDYRLLALFRYWNAINYFYPYKNIVDQDWDSTLIEFIPKIVNARDAVSYHLTFKELATRIDDSHSFVYSHIIQEQLMGDFYLPLNLKTIENETVVKDVFLNNQGIQAGDLIRSIDGMGISTLRDSLRKYAWGSNDAAINDVINSMILRGKKETVEMIVENPNGETHVTLSRDIPLTTYLGLIANTGAIWQVLDADSGRLNYGYVDMGRLEIAHIDSMFNDLWETDGIIFDLRCYPQMTMWHMIRYLFHGPIHVANILVPNIRYPGTFYWNSEPVGLGGFPITYYNPVLILIDENTISQAEYTAMAFEQHPYAVKIGSQTAGADGNVSFIYLPGGLYARFTSLGVFYPDYTETQRIGIIPDIEVYPTITGIRDGRDEILEAALQYQPEFDDDGRPQNQPEVPDAFLYQNYPNPFNSVTLIQFTMNQSAHVTVTILNTLGQRIRTLICSELDAGNFELRWDGENNMGQRVMSGVYLLKLQANQKFHTKKILLIR